MALSVLNNIASLAAQNQLSITNSNLQKSLFQLSSGSRINTGADDAAGLAIADGLHANISALTQSARNANDGVGELQVADGSLAQVTTLLNRAITLATEAATGTVSDTQRVSLDAEYTAIKAEIDRVGSKTNYNGGQVFTASTLNVFLSDANATSNSTIGVTTGLLSSTGLGLGGAVAATGTLTQAAGSAAIAATDTYTGAAFTESAVATGTFTVAGGNITAADTATIGGKTYTFVTALSPTATANEVVASSEATGLTNLKAAVNGAAGSGSTYSTNTIANTLVTAGAVTGTTLVFSAATAGANGNFLATASSAGSFATLDFTGGVDPGTPPSAVAGDTVTVGSQTYSFVANLNTAPTANQVEVLVGSTNTESLANLANAINGSSGSGVTYAYGSSATANTSAKANTGLTPISFTALTPGTAGNSINTTASGSAATAFGAAVLAGGTAGSIDG